jgi:integrase
MVDLKGVYKVTAKGKTYHYAWRGGPRLKGEPGSDEYIASLHAAREGRKTGPEGKMAALCARFRMSDAWRGKGRKPLSAKTRASWGLWLDRIQEEFGPLSIKQFDREQMRPRIEKWRDRYAATPRAADMGLQVLSRLLTFGQKEGDLMHNICKGGGIERLYEADRAAMIWTDADLEKLKAHASPEVYLAAVLAALTGLRQAVVLRAGWSHLQPHSLEIRSNKARHGKPGKLVIVPLYGELRAFLEGLPKKATTFCVNTEGRPWRSGFHSSWDAACERAGIEGLHFHDLRGTAATKFYRAGFSFREIAEILGWSEDDVDDLINRYVKKDELLKDRIRRLDEHAARTATAKRVSKPAPPNPT